MSLSDRVMSNSLLHVSKQIVTCGGISVNEQV